MYCNEARLGSGSRNDGGVLHGTMLAQGVGHERDSGAFLPDSHIEAVHVGILLGKDGVDADRRSCRSDGRR